MYEKRGAAGNSLGEVIGDVGGMGQIMQGLTGPSKEFRLSILSAVGRH